MKSRTLIAAIAVAFIAAPLAYAANVHFKGGTPTFTDQGFTLNTCFKLAGLGNQDITITVEAQGLATTICTNKGGNAAPGQNKTPVAPTGQVTIPSTQIKNGNVSVCLATIAPPAPTAVEAGCPNNNWTTTLEDVEFSSATITVVQGGKVVLQQTFRL